MAGARADLVFSDPPLSGFKADDYVAIGMGGFGPPAVSVASDLAKSLVEGLCMRENLLLPVLLDESRGVPASSARKLKADNVTSLLVSTVANRAPARYANCSLVNRHICTCSHLNINADSEAIHRDINELCGTYSFSAFSVLPQDSKLSAHRLSAVLATINLSRQIGHI